MRNDDVVAAYLGGASIRKVCQQFSIASVTVYEILKASKVELRTKSQAMKQAKRTLVSSETKGKISKALKAAHSEGRHNGWSFKNSDISRRSYPEKFFLNVIGSNAWLNVFDITEKLSVGKYFLDFAIVSRKIDIEIDGQQHYRTGEAIEHDRKRDAFMEEGGWLVYRICWLHLVNDTEKELNMLRAYLESDAVSSRTYEAPKLKLCTSCKVELKSFNKSGYCKKCQTVKPASVDKELQRKAAILSSGIDFTKYGWVQAASIVLNLSPQKIGAWMKKHAADTFNTCYVRKK